ncbi:MAG: DUF1707 domain-containing protein [Actinomycetota bacterium]|nr:DUF1707 domain-containing protein [Actinomycetota bacterium]
MRVSDAQRQRAIDELGRHLAAGRLDADEYTGRVEAAALSVELDELDRLLADLPMLRIAEPGAARRRLPPDGVAGARPLWRARLIVLASVVVLAAGIVLAVVAQWLALVALLGAWMIGAVQGRLFSARR